MFFFNCSTNIIGGAVQNAVNFIKELALIDDFESWGFILSHEVYTQVRQTVVNSKILVIGSPSKSLSNRRVIERFLVENDACLVYTSAGPAYIDIKCLHIMGCSNPYILGPSQYANQLIGNRRKRLKRYLTTLYQTHSIQKADIWITQTEYSKTQLENIIKNSNVYVVHNALSESFSNHNPISKKILNNKIIRCLVPTAYYKHKDLERIPNIAKSLKKDFPNLKFFLTLSDSSFEHIYKLALKHKVESMLVNLGPYNHDQALKIYTDSDLILQPSALEVFSTSYIEAIATGRPLVVPSLPFAKDICGNYPYYYDINCNKSYTSAIANAISYKDFNQRISLRHSILSKYSNQKERTEKILKIIKEAFNER